MATERVAVNRLDPAGAALYALVGIALVFAGAILAAATLTLEERAGVAAAIVAVLGYVAWRARSSTGE